MELSQRVLRIKPSPTLAITAQAAQLRAAGKDIISLSAGEPDFDTPRHVCEAAIAAIRKGETRYTPVAGIPALREAITEKFRRDNGCDYSADEILVSVGAKQSLYNLTQAILSPGDEAIIPSPYWVSYPDMVLLADGNPVIVRCGIEQGFKMSARQLAAAVTPRTRLVFLNSPSNPSGAVYTHDELSALGEVLRQHPKIIVASDDIYEHVRLGETPFCNLLMACPDLRDRIVLINGVSKAYAMTGWRIGYAAGPERLITAMKNIQSQSTSNPTSIAQHAALAALTGDQGCIEEMNIEFRRRHEFVVSTLNTLPDVRCLPANGAFYAFAHVADAIDRLEGIDDDLALGEYLIHEAGVAVVPGTAFGLGGYIRLSFATSMDLLEQALERIARALPGSD